MPDRSTYPPIEDYAIIGDCGSAALVSKDGSIDWLCWPRFDSPSIFAALLDRERGGFFQIAPSTEEYTVARRYVDDTNVLETTFTTDSGVLRLTDLMPVSDREASSAGLWPDHEVLRAVECTGGEVAVRVVCDPCLGYGQRNPRLERRGQLGYFYRHGSDVLVVRSGIPLDLSQDHGRLAGEVTLHEGERRYVALTYDQQEPAVLPLLGEHADQKVQQTIQYWEDWIGQCAAYDGPYRDAVIRSALVLKLMTYSRSGAVVAAPTTSLPEHVGGDKNWDYRYCWIRDAAFTLRALFELGYYQEEEAFFSWLLQATRLTLPELNVMYNVFGGTPFEEATLDDLDGYKQSRPVRVGNQAQNQFQLDIYGELISAAFEYVQRGRQLGRHQSKMLAALGEAICERWGDPDNGIWEIRSARRRHTYSLVMCWVGLHRLLQLHEEGHLDVPADRFGAVRDDIHDTIEQHGYNEALGSYTATLDGEMMDASLLLLTTYGYTNPDAPRMEGTWESVTERLAFDGLMYRYLNDDGSVPDEGAFGICSFWAVEYLVRADRLEETRDRLDDMLDHANDVGLFAEEIDPESGAMLGNFPQAFTHVGLINAVHLLADALEAGPQREQNGQTDGMQRQATAE